MQDFEISVVLDNIFDGKKAMITMIAKEHDTGITTVAIHPNNECWTTCEDARLHATARSSCKGRGGANMRTSPGIRGTVSSAV